MKTVVTFGEILGRLATRRKLRFRQSVPGAFDLTVGGAEANVAASIALLGGKARMASILPKQALADGCISLLAGIGVDVTGIERSENGRLGLYFLESGANHRGGQVIYDREQSTFSLTPASAYRWDELLCDAGWLHISGVTPALSEAAAEASERAMIEAKARGVRVSFDLNFRSKLWKWDTSLEPWQLAQKVLPRLMPYVDLFIANGGQAADLFDVRPAGCESEELAFALYPEVARSLVARFPNLSHIAFTWRESRSALHHRLGALFYDAGSESFVIAPNREGTFEPYVIENMVDRVGGGDAFSGALLMALSTPELSSMAVSFAVAASCLSHSILGDLNYVTRAEVEALMRGSGAGRVAR